MRTVYSCSISSYVLMIIFCNYSERSIVSGSPTDRINLFIHATAINWTTSEVYGWNLVKGKLSVSDKSQRNRSVSAGRDTVIV